MSNFRPLLSVVGEEARAPIFLEDATPELPAHERVHLGVLVDQAIDHDEQTCLLEGGDMVVKVRIAALGHGHHRVSRCS
jgi:hypothetical protein